MKELTDDIIYDALYSQYITTQSLSVPLIILILILFIIAIICFYKKHSFAGKFIIFISVILSIISIGMYHDKKEMQYVLENKSWNVLETKIASLDYYQAPRKSHAKSRYIITLDTGSYRYDTDMYYKSKVGDTVYVVNYTTGKRQTPCLRIMVFRN